MQYIIQYCQMQIDFLQFLYLIHFDTNYNICINYRFSFQNINDFYKNI